MILGVVVGSMIVYAVGVLTGVFIGSSIQKELSQRAKAKGLSPTTKDRQRILALLKDKQKITNDDVEKLLNVSDSTAQRYLQRLVEQNYLKQFQRTGRGVHYKLK